MLFFSFGFSFGCLSFALLPTELFLLSAILRPCLGEPPMEEEELKILARLFGEPPWDFVTLTVRESWVGEPWRLDAGEMDTATDFDDNLELDLDPLERRREGRRCCCSP